jgi:hypothetical protein
VVVTGGGGGGRRVFFEGVHLTGGPVLKKNKQPGRVLISRFRLGASSCTIRRDEIKSPGHTSDQTQTRVFLGLQMQYPGSR